MRYIFKLFNYRVFMLFLFGFLLTSSSTESFAKTGIALIIGNSVYENVPELRNPQNDAVAFGDALKRLDFEVIQGVNLSLQEMEESIEEFRSKLSGSNVSLFFYAGHGLQINGENYLLGTKAKLSGDGRLPEDAIGLSRILRIMERESETALVFLDACRDNPLTRQLSRAASNAGVSVGQGLASAEIGKGSFLAYSTQPGNVAIDGVGFNSPFAEALIRWIDEPGLEIRQVMTRVRQDVLKSTYGQQVPWDHSSLTGDFYFSSAKSDKSNLGESKIGGLTDEQKNNLIMALLDSNQPIDINDDIDKIKESFEKYYHKNGFAEDSGVFVTQTYFQGVKLHSVDKVEMFGDDNGLYKFKVIYRVYNGWDNTATARLFSMERFVYARKRSGVIAISKIEKIN